MSVAKAFIALCVPGGSATFTVEELASAIRRAILAGNLADGEALPTIRDLAKGMAVSPHTVMRAYRRIADEGFLVAPRFPRGRYVVSNADRRVRAENRVLAHMVREFVRVARKRGFMPSQIQAAWEDEWKNKR